jgi:cleavage stimulation factor subunit 2
MGAEACKALKEQVPGLAEAMEQVQHLLDMAAADEAAEEARRKKRASAAEESDQHAKLGKVEDGGKAAVCPILPAFFFFETEATSFIH